MFLCGCAAFHKIGASSVSGKAGECLLFLQRYFPCGCYKRFAEDNEAEKFAGQVCGFQSSLVLCSSDAGATMLC